MRIRDVMTKNPIVVESEALILDALKLMKENNIRRLPVVEKGKLVGIVTQKDLDQAAPAPATATGTYEFHSFLKMRVKEVMKKDPVTLGPDTPFEEVLRIGKENKISSFPIVEGGKLVEIATESDIARFLVRVLGLEEEGSRIVGGVRREDRRLAENYFNCR